MEDAYRTWYPAIREKCRRMLGDEDAAHDVAQETFVRLWRTGPLGGEARTVLAWIYRTATRLSVDHLRRRSRHARLVRAVPEASWSDGIAHAEHRRLLLDLARHLPRADLEVALLHRVDGLTFAELTEVTRLSERTLRRRLRRIDTQLLRLREGQP